MHKLSAIEPFWLDLVPGVRVLFAPVSRAADRAANRAVMTALANFEDRKSPEAIETAGDAYSEALIRAGLRAWEGVGDADGAPVDVTPQTVELFLATPRLFAAADRLYVGPYVDRDAEKNASAASPNGTLAGRTRAKPTARTAAKPAPTAPTKSRPAARPKAKPPGKPSAPASARSAPASGGSTRSTSRRS